MFVFMLMYSYYDHYTYIIQVNAIHSTASECSKSQVDHTAAFMRQQQTQAVQHNGHDEAKRHSVAWLNTGNSRHIISHTEQISCQSGPRCNHNGQHKCSALPQNEYTSMLNRDDVYINIHSPVAYTG
jgi:hypothetical protein